MEAIGWAIVAFVAGAFLGAPLWSWIKTTWSWIKTKLPWNK